MKKFESYKNWINEKFTQDSDPISDLHIGLAAQLEDWIKTTNEYKGGFTSKEKDYLWICSKHNQVDFVRYLLGKGADVHAENDTALQLASGNGHEKVVKLLLDAGADVHAENDDALRRASANGHEKVVKVLLDAGADVHAENDTALRWASGNGHKEVVKILLDAGADVHAYNDYALRWASANGHEKVVKVLLDVGADVHAENDDALRWASGNSHTEVIKMLKDHIAKEKKVKESLNEKFTEDTDPVQDLGIGMKELWKKYLKEIGPMYESDFCRKYNISKKKLEGYENAAVVIYKTFLNIIENNMEIQNAFENACNEWAIGVSADKRGLRIRKYMAEILKKRFNTNVNPNFNLYGIKESLNEVFTQDSDPIEDMNIGLRVKIEKWLKDMGITAYRLTPEMEINVYDDTYLTRKVNEALPDYIQFNIVVGDFTICLCELTTLKGCPREIWGYFNCANNKLESLEFAPKEVHMTRKKSGGFYCGYNTKKFTKEEVELVCDVEGGIRV